MNPPDDFLKMFQLPTDSHSEALTLVERQRDFLENYARRSKISVLPAPAGLNTFAFDFEKNVIYVNSLFYEKKGFSDEKTLFSVCHEIEHFLEKIQILSQEEGDKKFEALIKKIKSSRAYSAMDNILADIHENRSVVLKTEPGWREIEVKIYKEDLFVENDFSKEPRHLQFLNALLRESRLPDEACIVSDEVREKLDKISKGKNEGLIDLMTDPDFLMSSRIEFQDELIWPIVKELLDKDIEDKKKEQEDKESEEGGDDENKDKGDKSEEGGEKGEESEDKEGDKKESEGKGKGKSKEDSADKSDKESKEGGESKSTNSVNKKGAGSGGAKKEKTLDIKPDLLFEDAYKRIEEKFPEAVSIDQIEKAVEKWKVDMKPENIADRADQLYAESIGVSKFDLQNYRKVVENLQKVINPETGVEVLEELKNLFSRIIAKRFKLTYAPKYPTEEGDNLIDPAQLVADFRSGNLEPKVWEDVEIKEKKGDSAGEVEITLVCDRSGSMEEGTKMIEQQKSAVLIMEALEEFSKMCEREKINVDKPLEVRSEVYSFDGRGEDHIPLKVMSPELGEAERINILQRLGDVDGGTTDYICLDAINNSIDKKTINKIIEGELKKIVIVLTDGGSNSPEHVQHYLNGLASKGVVTIGVGITESGSPVLETYKPKALVVKDVRRLPFVLGELLKEHLKDL